MDYRIALDADNFNPRSRKGSDKSRLGFASARMFNFNPRSRKGSDVRYLYSDLTDIHFNPRSRKGSDVLLNVLLACG